MADIDNPQTDQSQLTRNKGQLPGTTTNDSALTGNVGEFLLVGSANPAAGNSTVTITIASPAVVTWTAHPYVCTGTTSGAGIISFSTTVALPTGIVSGTNYYVIGSSITTNTFQIATSSANAIAGTAINTSGTQAGTQSAINTFNATTATAVDVAGLLMPAGDWDVFGDAVFSTAVSTTVAQNVSSLSQTSNTLDTSAIGFYTRRAYGNAVLNGLEALVCGPARVSLATPTNLFLVARSTFGVSACQPGGLIRARRIR